MTKCAWAVTTKSMNSSSFTVRVLVIVLMAIVLATQTVIESDSENFVSNDSDDDYQSGENDDIVILINHA
jgi:hypothetical protein